MLVQDIMCRSVITVEGRTRLTEAYQTMQHHRIRHLPVLEEGRLVGVITDRDLRLATSALSTSPFEPEDRVAGVMSTSPVTAGPLDPVEEAARLMRERRIGCLPVLEGDNLVGIITVTDLLDAILRLTGVSKPAGRLAVDVEDAPGELARLSSYIAEQGVNIHSILSYYADVPGRIRVILRVGTTNTRALARKLREHDFDVRWPVEKPTGPVA